MRMNDQQEMSIAMRKPALEQSTTRPCKSSLGAKAIEWRPISSLPHCLLDRVEDRFQLAFDLKVERHEDLGPTSLARGST